MKSGHSLPDSVWRNPVHFLAFGCGAGAAPLAPGTFGTLAAVPLYLFIADLHLPFYLALVTLLFVLGVWLCGETARDIGVHDHPGIVWDEVVGFLLAMTAAPPGWAWLVAGFLLFRLFDIWKPWPIRHLDRKLGGGVGIMLDDVIAGLYGAAVLQVAAHILS